MLVKEILKDGSTNHIQIKDINIFGFDGSKLCSIGQLSLIVRSSFNKKYDLAYIDYFNGSYIVGLLSELKPQLKI